MEIEKLYKDCLPLVISIASKYKDKGVSFEDLIQEGFLGILEAKERFDPSKGTKFSTYAFYWIKKKILEAIQREKSQSLNSLELNEAILEGYTAEKAYENEDFTLPSLNKTLNKNLSPLEQKIFTLYFQQGNTLSEISKKLGIARERVRQIKQLLLRKLKINQKLTENL